jgi:hypothetical protein
MIEHLIKETNASSSETSLSIKDALEGGLIYGIIKNLPYFWLIG